MKYLKILRYQNGGDWTWFSARMIQKLIKNGFYEEAYQQLQPMVKRVKDNDGFFYPLQSHYHVRRLRR